jgi:hypothetical protein
MQVQKMEVKKERKKRYQGFLRTGKKKKKKIKKNKKINK